MRAWFAPFAPFAPFATATSSSPAAEPLRLWETPTVTPGGSDPAVFVSNVHPVITAAAPTAKHTALVETEQREAERRMSGCYAVKRRRAAQVAERREDRPCSHGRSSRLLRSLRV